MRIKSVEIQNKGNSVQIETDHKSNYKYIWLDANDLVDIAKYSEHL